MFDWAAIVVRLHAYPRHYHRLLPPCVNERMEAVEKELGALPATLTEMLRHFNGAELFVSAGASFTLFGISLDPPLSPLEWAPDWCIDSFTAKWREAGANRDGDWAIAMTGYGGLILLSEGDTIKEWDVGQGAWLSTGIPIETWMESILAEGEVLMADA